MDKRYPQFVGRELLAGLVKACLQAGRLEEAVQMLVLAEVMASSIFTAIFSYPFFYMGFQLNAALF